MGETKKSLLILSVIALLLFVFTNIVSYYAIKRLYGVSMFDGDAYAEKKRSLIKRPDESQIPHPFFGMTRLDWHVYKNPLTDEPLFHHISARPVANEIVVLVVGGSVALDLSDSVRVQIEKGLFATRLNRTFETDRFVVYNAALGGGKQPQQYFKFLYLDLLGFRPNVVLNLDGYNEIALPLVENRELKNPAIYPRSYSRLLASAVAVRDCAKMNNQLLELNSVLPVVELVAWVYANLCDKQITGTAGSPPWWARGLNVRNDTDYANQSIAIWRDSSNKLAQALSSRDIDYVHVIQPNQYLEGSKIFSEEEKEKYLNFRQYGEPIHQYYGRLVPGELLSKNVRDQRFLFKDVKETVYIDACCHFNEHGMELIVDDIIRSNRSVFAKHLK
jgi:hypothetical protein